MADEITGVGRGVEALLASGPLGATVGCLLWWIWRKDSLDRERSKAAGERADVREREHTEAMAIQRRDFLAELARAELASTTAHEKHVAALERVAEVMRLTLDSVTRRAAEKGSRNVTDTKSGPGGVDAGGPGA